MLLVHFIFYGTTKNDVSVAIDIVCVLKEAVEGRYSAIRIDRKGHYEFSIPDSDFKEKRKGSYQMHGFVD